MLEDLFSEMDLCILSNDSVTGYTSALDLSICAPSLVLARLRVESTRRSVLK